MSRILVLTSYYLPEPSANGINTEYIIEELKKRGHQVTCISVARDGENKFDVINGVPIYRIEDTVYGRQLDVYRNRKMNFLEKGLFYVLKYARIVKSIFIFFKFPDVELSQSKKRYRLALKLHQKNNFDCILGVFRPFSGIAATILMKKKYPSLLCGAYYLDLISGATKPPLIPRKFYKVLCNRGELAAFSKLDFILMAKGGRNTYTKQKFNSVNKKIRYIDFPLFAETIIKHNVKYEESKINLVYTGTLNRYYRNPEYLLKIFNIVSEKLSNIALHIYGKGDCKDIIEEYKIIGSFEIVEYGMVSHDIAKAAMYHSDYIINISNSSPNMVPSKIFEMFSTGKPIINVVSNKNDIAIGYFNRYPAVINILEWESDYKQVQCLIEFLKTQHKKKFSIDSIKEIFIENTPAYTVNLFEDIIEEWYAK